ncbi:twitching motility protein PilT [Spirochaetia bacterium]|nr:twitching motility protein PilT [Spirochaetia bacterium]
MTQFLIDTNIVLWLADENPRVDRIKPLLLSGDTQVFISVVSWWEIVIKIRRGKLNANFEQIRTRAYERGFLELPITGNCLKAYLELPDLHKDPFDHMLLAQAVAEPMRFITGDSLLADYSSLVMAI